MTSYGLGNTDDPSVRHQLKVKFPARSRPLPHSVPKHKPIDAFKNLRDSLLSLNSGTAPGSRGLRNEFLYALGERMTDEEIKLLEELGLAYTSGELPNWFYMVWLSLQTVAPYKTADRNAVRPLGLRNSLIKVFHKEPMVQSKSEVREYLEPVQVGISVAGAALLTRSVCGVLNTFTDFICF